MSAVPAFSMRCIDLFILSWLFGTAVFTYRIWVTSKSGRFCRAKNTVVVVIGYNIQNRGNIMKLI